jgi:hypothetical protein
MDWKFLKLASGWIQSTMFWHEEALIAPAGCCSTSPYTPSWKPA